MGDAITTDEAANFRVGTFARGVLVNGRFVPVPIGHVYRSSDGSSCRVASVSNGTITLEQIVSPGPGSRWGKRWRRRTRMARKKRRGWA